MKNFAIRSFGFRPSHRILFSKQLVFEIQYFYVGPKSKEMSQAAIANNNTIPHGREVDIS